jgi:hypothetical protein
MKTKIKILIVSFVIAAAAVTGFNMAQESSNMDVSLADIAVMQMAIGEPGQNPEYPHYGKYGRTLWGCSVDIEVTGSGTVCYKGVCVDYTASGTIHISCENCAWDCNTSGANNTCDPEDC